MSQFSPIHVGYIPPTETTRNQGKKANFRTAFCLLTYSYGVCVVEADSYPNSNPYFQLFIFFPFFFF
jgi:hypothetical protein